MSTYGTNVGEKFARNTLKQFYQKAVTPLITNQDYEGELKGGGADRLNVLTFGKVSLKNYTGATMSADTVTESESILLVNQKKAYYFEIESFAKFSSYAEDPKSTLIKQCGDELQETVDAFVLGLYGDVEAGNRVGTDVTSGTITVTVTSGAFVIAAATPVTSAWVGRGIKCAGHTVWYRVKSTSSTTEGVIEDDLDDVTSAYTGGAIAGGSTYTCEAVTKLQVSKTTIYQYINALAEKLDEKKVPKSDRWIVVPAKIASLIRQATEFIPAVQMAYQGVVIDGMIGKICGFIVYETQQVYGNNTDGYRVLAGTTTGITFAMAYTESGIEDAIGAFGEKYKGLSCYGAKVADVNRKCLAEGFWYV